MAPPLPRRPSSELVDDAIIDILLRLPPEEPALLVRASLLCRQWRRVLSDPAFLRLYARIHRTPPLLGFFDSSYPHYSLPRHAPRFVPIPAMAAASRVSSSSLAASPWLVLDCRHGRVLLQRRRHTADDDAALSISYQQLVWDPITGDQHELRWPDVSRNSAAVYVVLCAAAAATGCDHSSCRGGPFLVLCAGVRVHRPTRGTGTRGTGCGGTAYACVYSSQLRAWFSPALLHLHAYESFDPRRRGVVIGHQVYLFRFSLGVGDDGRVRRRILKYDMRRHRLSVIDLPDLHDMGTDVQLMATEDGLLGLASTGRSPFNDRICLWSRTADAGEGVARWVRRSVIDLRAMSMRMISYDSNRIISRANVIGFAEGVNAILVGTNAGTFVIDLKSEQARKVCNAGIYIPVVPFLTFYSPGCACGKLPLPVETN